jgi:hypothetical protein
MNPALDKYYESLLELKGGAKKKGRGKKKSSKKKSSGKKKKTSGKKKKSTRKKKNNNKRQPRIIDHTVGNRQLEQILSGIPILSPVNSLLTSVETYNPIIPYTYNEPNYSSVATPGAVPGAVPGATPGAVPSTIPVGNLGGVDLGGVDPAAFLLQDQQNLSNSMPMMGNQMMYNQQMEMSPGVNNVMGYSADPTMGYINN